MIPISQRFNLSRKVALVTGASRGIGASVARALAECGALVVLCSRQQAVVDAGAQSLQEEGLQAIGMAANIGQPGEASALVQKIISVCGSVDILVNNAAANPVYGPITDSSLEAFDKVMAVNVKAPLELSQCVYHNMLERRGGSIINISSAGGLTPEPGLGIYSISKAALISLTKVLAKEWGKHGIRVNAICPGLIKTKFSEALWENEKILGRIEQTLPLQRIGHPDEVTGAVLFLASDAGAYCTGAVYTVDGGLTI